MKHGCAPTALVLLRGVSLKRQRTSREVDTELWQMGQNVKHA